MFIKILFFAFLFNITTAESSEIKQWLTNESKFTVGQINSLSTLLENAERENLPTKYLHQRVKEGVRKNVEYIILYAVLREKINKLQIAKFLLEELYKPLPQKDMDYCVQFLAELLHQGLSVYDFVKLARSIQKLDVKPKDLLNYSEILFNAKQSGIDVDQIEEIIIRGIKEKRKDDWIKKEIIELERKKIKEEIKEELEKKPIER